MKRKFRIMALLLTLFLVMQSPMRMVYAQTRVADNQLTEKIYIHDEMVGVWVTTVFNLDYPTRKDLSVKQLKEEADSIINNMSDMGVNTIYLQVRPQGDAFYQSSLYPWSKYLTSNTEAFSEKGFDPLEYWIEKAHSKNISIHAWINPYRVTKGSSKYPQHDLNALDDKNPARQHPDWVVKHSDGSMYLDPGNPEVINYVVEGVRELVNNYEIDGIHFDDYFYPGQAFNDEDTFYLFGRDFESIDDWRRYNVDLLVQSTKKAIDEINDQVVFGISPFAIWKNQYNDSKGSKTSGLESYYKHYADTKKWVEEGWIDYICPQIYWEIGFNVADYAVLVDWWAEVVKDTDVQLYVGHAAYRAGNTDINSPWYGSQQIIRQLEYNENVPEVDGSIFFRYRFLVNNEPLNKALTEYYNPFNR